MYYGKFNTYCGLVNASPQYLNILFSVIMAILYSFGPFIVMTVINTAIMYKFMLAKWKSRQGGTESTSQALSKSATRGTAMLLTVSFAFIILTGPIAFANAIWEEGTLPLLVEDTGTILQYMNHGITVFCIVSVEQDSERNYLKR